MATQERTTLQTNTTYQNGQQTNGSAPATPASSATVNQLNALGEKIFLDRYALKDAKKETVQVDDLVVVAVDLATGQRELGQVIAVDGKMLTIELRDGTMVERALEHIDKPLEIRPEQMLDRVAHGIAQMENLLKNRLNGSKTSAGYWMTGNLSPVVAS
jgi:hypothetical protein